MRARTEGYVRLHHTVTPLYGRGDKFDVDYRVALLTTRLTLPAPAGGFSVLEDDVGGVLHSCISHRGMV